MITVGDYLKVTAVATRKLLDVQLAPFFEEDGPARTNHYRPGGGNFDFDEIFGEDARAPGGVVPRTLGDVLDGDALLAELEENIELQFLVMEMIYQAKFFVGAVTTGSWSKDPYAFIDFTDWLPRGLQEILEENDGEFDVVVGPGPVGELFDAVDALWAKVEEGTLDQVKGLPPPDLGLAVLEETITVIHELSVAARKEGADFVAFH